MPQMSPLMWTPLLVMNLLLLYMLLIFIYYNTIANTPTHTTFLHHKMSTIDNNIINFKTNWKFLF